jgi:hypothetical protein
LDVLEDFLEKERTGGEVVGGEATFTLDPNKVRERVAIFSQQNTLYPLYRCLQAIISVCDGDIFIQRQEKTWEVNFRWPNCPPGRAFADLLNLGTTAGFDKVGHRVAQHLFFGFSAALGTDSYQIEWNSPNARFVAKDGNLTVLEPDSKEYSQLAFTLESKWWQRLIGQNSVAQIHDELRERLCYSPRPIHLERALIVPAPPQAPEQPWGAKLIQGSDLAWRFIRIPDQNLLTVPYPELDYYRCNKEGQVFHLIGEPESSSLPLSVAFHDPGRKTLKKGQTSNLSLSLSSRAHSALFLSLETGRQDWLVPVCDGVTTEPVPVNIAGGGIVALTSDQSLSYDLSGLKVIENDAFRDLLSMLKAQSKAMKKQLAVSVANVSVRSKALPKQYDQALSYLVGGPYAGLLGGRFGQIFRRMTSSREPSP